MFTLVLKREMTNIYQIVKRGYGQMSVLQQLHLIKMFFEW